MKRKYDGYEAKLVRLERAQAAAATAAATNQGANMALADDAAAEFSQRGGGAGYEDGAGAAVGDYSSGGRGAGEGRGAYAAGPERFAAPVDQGGGETMAAPGTQRRRDDDFADADLSDLLVE
jgi:hypothetical protein